MPKVIQFIKSKLELHRGKKSISSNPYSYRSNLKRKEKRVLNWTLDSFHLSPRCSRTFGLSFRKESPAKKASKNFEMKVNSISKFDNSISFNSHARLIGASSAILLLSLLTLTVLPVVHNDDSADAATGTATQSSTTVSVSTATASVDLTATSTDGTFATSTGSGIASFDVTTTNYTGYTLTIEADDDDGTLTNGSGGTFTSISSVMDEKTFDDSTYNGKWGYKPSKMNGVENVGFWPSPTTTATTLDTTKVANTTANTYTIALGARASASQAAGTYSKTVTITATSNPANYSITYADNTGKAATNLPDATTSTTSGTSIALSNVTPSKTGFVFGGWCSTAPTVAADYTTTCSGTTYQAGGTYGIDQTTENITTLYATWTIPKYTITIKTSTGISSVSLNGTSCSNSTTGCTVNNLTYGQSYTLTATASTGYTFSSWYVDGLGNVASSTADSTNFTVGQGAATITANAVTSLLPYTTVMQNFTNSMCQTYAQNGIALTDSRDNHVYNVRWINGNCWMTDNLTYGSSMFVSGIINPDTTSFTVSKNDSNVAADRTFTAYDLVSHGTNTTGSNECYYDISGQTDTGLGYSTPCIHTSDDGRSVWYNYAAATAGTITGTSNTTAATEDICPKGWSLPTLAQIQTIGDNTSTYIEPFNALCGGNFAGGTNNYADRIGYWWTSTAQNGQFRYNLRLQVRIEMASAVDARGLGAYVRCVRNS